MTKKLVIFDLDGTLVDTITDLANATNHALHTLGYQTFAIDDYKTKVGNGINKLFERALPEGEKTEENVTRVRQTFIPFYNNHCVENSRPYTGMVEILEELQKTGIKIAVASNKYQEAVDMIIPRCFPSINFTAIEGQRKERATKPNPAIVHDILKKAEVLKEDVLYVGDSGVDMQTGCNSGVETCGVTWGFRSREELAFFHPQHLVDNASQLHKIIFHC